jgi:prepilin-type N-terminal cleavage/methylation domain-containing protein
MHCLHKQIIHLQRHFPAKNQSGFTLLEIVLVLFLISLMASTTLFITDNLDDQASYDETKRRMEIIRQAIVGDPTRRINGQTEISGFAADMGRLPECIAELLEVSTAIPSTTPTRYSSPCTSSTSNLIEWHIDSSTGIPFGWRGPYIRVTPESNGFLRFRDGYRNSNNTDSTNSAWDYSVDASGGISLNSIGQDASAATDDDIYDSQFVVSSDWRVDQILLNIRNQDASNALPTTGTSHKISLKIYKPDSNYEIHNVENDIEVTVSASDAIPSNGSKNYIFSFDASDAIPSGVRGYTVVCDTNGVIFDGDCELGNGVPTPNDIETFIVVPRQTSTLNWTIP